MSSSRNTITDTSKTIDWATEALVPLLLLVKFLPACAPVVGAATICDELSMVGVAEKAGMDEGKTSSNDMKDRLTMGDRPQKIGDGDEGEGNTNEVIELVEKFPPIVSSTSSADIVINIVWLYWYRLSVSVTQLVNPSAQRFEDNFLTK